MPDSNRIDEFVSLFTKHELRLRACAMALVPRKSDAEDIVQQSSLLLWTKFDSFQTGSNFMGWAARIVLYEAHRHRRRHMRDRLRFGDDFLEALATEAAATDATEAMAEQELKLANCMAKLRPEHQELLRARYADGWTIERISATFNRSAEAIYNVLSRIRRTLQVCVTGPAANP